MPEVKIHNPPMVVVPERIDCSRPWAYFDGAATAQGCWGGAILHLNDNNHYQLRLGLGPGTNNYAKLQCLRLLMAFAWEKICNTIQIFGDSLLVVNWFNAHVFCHSHTLSALLWKVHHLRTLFDIISMDHIYRSQNYVVDQLSKEAKELTWGT